MDDDRADYFQRKFRINFLRGPDEYALRNRQASPRPFQVGLALEYQGLASEEEDICEEDMSSEESFSSTSDTVDEPRSEDEQPLHSTGFQHSTAFVHIEVNRLLLEPFVVQKKKTKKKYQECNFTGKACDQIFDRFLSFLERACRRNPYPGRVLVSVEPEKELEGRGSVFDINYPDDYDICFGSDCMWEFTECAMRQKFATSFDKFIQKYLLKDLLKTDGSKLLKTSGSKGKNVSCSAQQNTSGLKGKNVSHSKGKKGERQFANEISSSSSSYHVNAPAPPAVGLENYFNSMSDAKMNNLPSFQHNTYVNTVNESSPLQFADEISSSSSYHVNAPVGGLSPYFSLMLDAKERDLPFFQYKGTTYVKTVNPNAPHLGPVYKKKSTSGSGNASKGKTGSSLFQ